MQKSNSNKKRKTRLIEKKGDFRGYRKLAKCHAYLNPITCAYAYARLSERGRGWGREDSGSQYNTKAKR